MGAREWPLRSRAPRAGAGGDMPKPLKLLLIEDDEDDAELVRRALEKGGFALEWERVDSEESLSRALDRAWDIVISDFAMPGFSGLRAFDLFRARNTDTPFVFVSGALGEERAVEAMRAGAKDYFLKGNLARLEAAVKRELQEAENRRERRLAEARAAHEQRRLALAIEASNTGVFEINVGGGAGTVDFSGPWANILGREIGELPGHSSQLRAWLADAVHPEDQAVLAEEIETFRAAETDRLDSEFRLRHADGHWVDVAVLARAVARDRHDGPQQVAGVLLDLSARKQLEAQLRQAQKMEAVGQLAGGIAHDFNNLLTAILSFCTFAREAVEEAGPIAQDLDEVLKAAHRAQSLTAQLLAFSRRKKVVPRIINVNETVAGTDRILKRLLGADIEVLVELEPELGNTKIDPDALEQVLLNLAVNARDAMPGGGRLTIATRNARVDTPESNGTDVATIAPGSYVVITVRDTGTGMDAATQARMFEPFFTTKEPGRGTGLGLSTCYGIVKQAEGVLRVDSAPGAGTTFEIYLPQVEGAKDAAAPLRDPTSLRGTETVLIAEDDDQVRKLAARTLTRHGYTVIETTNGGEALAVAETTVTIHLLLTDVVMPVIGGRKLVELVLASRPSLPVLYMSGYSEVTIEQRGLLRGGERLLQKPFTPESLARAVRQLLDERSAAKRANN